MSKCLAVGKAFHAVVFAGALLGLSVSTVRAEGAPGSPSATTTISGKQLPPPDPKFGGVIKEKAAESKPWWPPTVAPPKGAPNVLLIMTDDVGFAAPSTFGGVIPTPALDRIAKMPDKLKEMQALFYAEAKKYHVLPLDNSTLPRLLTPRPSVAAGRKVFTYSGEHSGIPNGSEPSILQRSYTITAEVDIPEGGAEGMIVTQGGRFGGYGFFLSKGELDIGRGKPVFLYNLLDLKRTTWEGPELKRGKHTITFDFKFDGGGFGKGGTGTLIVDGKEVDKKSMEHTVPFIFQWDETFDVGMDTGTPVAFLEYHYDVPFRFTGKLNKLTFDLQPQQLTAEERRVMQALGQRNNRASE